MGSDGSLPGSDFADVAASDGRRQPRRPLLEVGRRDRNDSAKRLPVLGLPYRDRHATGARAMNDSPLLRVVDALDPDARRNVAVGALVSTIVGAGTAIVRLLEERT